MQRFSKPSPSMFVALAALVVAMGGTSYAAVSITSRDVRNNSLTGADIKNSSLTSSDVRNGSLKAADFKAGQLPAGAKGDKGPAGSGRWALVDASGAIEAQSGGFSVTSGYGANPAGAAGNVYINANEDLSNNAIVATIALQNQVDQNGDAILNGRAAAANANPEFAGEISATRCAIVSVVACAPSGTNNSNHFVVSPRLSDGQVTDTTNRKRFYVIITGDSTDPVAP